MEYGEFSKLTAASEKKTAGAAPLRWQLTQPTLGNTCPYEGNSQKAKQITQKLIEFIGLHDQPLSVLEDPGFRRLLSHLEPRYVLLNLSFSFFEVLFTENAASCQLFLYCFPFMKEVKCFCPNCGHFVLFFLDAAGRTDI